MKPPLARTLFWFSVVLLVAGLPIVGPKLSIAISILGSACAIPAIVTRPTNKLRIAGIVVVAISAFTIAVSYEDAMDPRQSSIGKELYFLWHEHWPSLWRKEEPERRAKTQLASCAEQVGWGVPAETSEPGKASEALPGTVLVERYSGGGLQRASEKKEVLFQVLTTGELRWVMKVASAVFEATNVGKLPPAELQQISSAAERIPNEELKSPKRLCTDVGYIAIRVTKSAGKPIDIWEQADPPHCSAVAISIDANARQVADTINAVVASYPEPKWAYKRGDNTFKIASILERGSKSCEALIAYHAAAGGGNCKAARRLSEIYEQGLLGFRQDPEEAANWQKEQARLQCDGA